MPKRVPVTLGVSPPLLILALIGLLLLGGADPQVTTAEPAPVVRIPALARARTVERELVSALRHVETASVTVIGRQALRAARRQGEAAPFVLHGAGSGVLVRWNGTWVLTNAHVVKQTGRLEAITSDGAVHPLEVRATDAAADLAIARLTDAPAGLRAARVPRRSSAQFDVGTWVTSAGNPFLLALDGRSAATVGVISAVRPILPTSFVRVPTVQHDAEVNPGNSGGPLWSLGGELLGINGSIATHSTRSGDAGPSYTGASFAVPLDAIRAFLTRVLGPDRDAAPATPGVAGALREVQARYRHAIERVLPSAVVCMPRGVRGSAAGFSSGVVVHPRGLILSDGDAGLVWQRRRRQDGAEVVRTWQDALDVRMWDSDARVWRTVPGRVVHRDRDVDTSLVQLLEIPVGGLRQHVPPGRSATLRTGRVTLAVGTADDERLGAPPSLTAGLVSAIDPGADGFLYTSAGVNRGANGGALVGLDGRLIGTISTYVEAEADVPFGFLGKAVPIDRILHALRNVPEARPLLARAPAAGRGETALESVIHDAGRRIRGSLVSLEIDRARPVSTTVPLEGREVELARYTGPVSGVVADASGLVVTSLHNLTNVAERVDPTWEVPAGAALADGIADIRRVRIRAPGGESVPAKLVGYDFRWGFALLRAERPLRGAVVPAPAPASDLERGRFLITAGDPYGSRPRRDPLMTMGILSKRHSDTADAPWRGMWQTDAGAVDGNVGGAAVDLDGRIVGMLTVWDPARHGRNSGIGFVVPWGAIQAAIPRLLEGKPPQRGLLGVYFRGGPTPVISRVSAGSAAARAGLRGGDTIRAVDEHATPTVFEVYHSLGQRIEGERVRLVIERGGRRQRLDVALGARPASEP